MAELDIESRNMKTLNRMKPNNQVSFDIEKILTKIDNDLEEIKSSLNRKAERSEVENLRNTVEELRRHGSDHARDALSQLSKLDMRVHTLEISQVREDAIDDITRRSNEQGARLKLAIWGLAITAVGVLLSFGLGIAALLWEIFGKR